MESGRRAVLTLRGVSKSFGGLRAVIDVDLDLYEGEVLAIVGDNGAGKSTLIKILTGVHRADSGEIRIDGEKAEITSRRDSIDAGIEAVYQNLGLVNSLPAPANVFLGQEPVWRVMGVPFIDNRTMRRETERILRERVGIVLENLDDPVHNYSGGQRQAVAIARAIFNTELRVLVLDEPTAALGPQETRKTLELIRGIKERGISVILISHNLENVFSVADRVQVMRGGRSAGVVEVAKSTRKEVLGLIVGSEDVAADAYA
ncbi:ATP-binding cassette domain-containing protein [Chelativorans sp. M5D2P16]|uniref:ATP-binding cassette domain-containing protein n=1 Tax=Chelativorans sp. M5D2P16 TaxID=3095678 RepID=UPI002ACA9E1D|nr:ATP-binding cassette domain-containing protein [Chelativorans sp. M5D2P16]MDZ5699071.1 ATP-binding cassette domain-containing protein [Chelativorans sp. M5D2P16]